MSSFFRSDFQSSCDYNLLFEAVSHSEAVFFWRCGKITILSRCFCLNRTRILRMSPNFKKFFWLIREIRVLYKFIISLKI
jgi:hypothetical protein